MIHAHSSRNSNNVLKGTLNTGRVFKNGNKDIKNDGFYKLWQALLYLHPGCPAVSQLSPSPISFFNFFFFLICRISSFSRNVHVCHHRCCRSDDVFSHVLNSWKPGKGISGSPPPGGARWPATTATQRHFSRSETGLQTLPLTTFLL